jgi:hypothetical protein
MVSAEIMIRLHGTGYIVFAKMDAYSGIMQYSLSI